MESFISNDSGYYFRVFDDIDISLLDGCRVHNSEPDMHAYIERVYDMECDTSSNINISNKHTNEGSTFGWYAIKEPSLEKYISEFSL